MLRIALDKVSNHSIVVSGRLESAQIRCLVTGYSESQVTFCSIDFRFYYSSIGLLIILILPSTFEAFSNDVGVIDVGASR